MRCVCRATSRAQPCTYFSFFFLIVPSVFNIHDICLERYTGKKKERRPFFFSFLHGKRVDAVVQIVSLFIQSQDGDRNKYRREEGGRRVVATC